MSPFVPITSTLGLLSSATVIGCRCSECRYAGTNNALTLYRRERWKAGEGVDGVATMTTENTLTMTDVDPITRVCEHGAFDELCAEEGVLSARVRKVPKLHCAGI